MIIFEKLRYKNFLSVGNKFITIDFIKGKKKVFVGPNGSGKSSIIDALNFALYNRSFRKSKKEQLVNSINKKNLLVELEFSVGIKKYKIRRGVKPGICELYIDGVLKEMGSNLRDYQAYIENSVLRMSERTFKQIVVLGSTDYVPFMKLPAYIKRTVSEDLLDISIFTSMTEVVKRKATVAAGKYNDILNDIKIITSDIKTRTDTLSKISDVDETEAYKKSKAEEEEKLKQLEKDEADYVSNFPVNAENLIIIKKSISEKQEKLKKMVDLYSKIENNEARSKKIIEFLTTNDTCHECKQTISKEHKSKFIKSQNEKIEEFTDGLENLNAIISEVNNDIEKYTDEKRELEDSIEQLKILKNSKITIKDKINYLNNHMANSKETNQKLKDSLQQAIELSETELEELENSKDLLSDKAAELSYISSVLKDDGIKSKIIKTYLPIINKLIRKYLDILNFDIDFRFDEFFEETIKAQYKDNFHYGNFSTGQKLRIDLAILFTWRELSKLKNSTATNLIILDEIHSSSLDNEGSEAFNSVIAESIKKDECAIIITHNPETVGGEYVTHTHSMINNFTDVKITKTQ